MSILACWKKAPPFLLASLIFLLVGCTSLPAPQGSVETGPAPITVTGAPSPSPEPVTLPLPVLATDPLATPSTIPPTLTPFPLAPSPAFNEADITRYTFPTPAAAPVSLWRPPLYDAPWALGPFDHFYFVRPIAADVVNWPLANYRYGGVFAGSEIIHTGIDIPSRMDTPVYAAGEGKVVWAGYGLYLGSGSQKDPYGQAVTIAHDFSYDGRRLYTVYAHLDRILAIEGQQVQSGDLIGLVGMTGNTTGPHLHFEVRIQENTYFSTRNPELWLVPPQGWGILVGQLRNTNGSFLTKKEVYVTSLDTRKKWMAITYGNHTVKMDAYYQENFVLSDLPAGTYQISIDYADNSYDYQVDINPGAVTYFTFRGVNGYSQTLPPIPSSVTLPATP